MNEEEFAKLVEDALGEVRLTELHMNVGDVLKQIEFQRSLYQSVIAEEFVLDEMAIAFGDELTLSRFVSALNRHPGITHFGGDIDQVAASPLSSSYLAQFEWLSTPLSFRIEAMRVVKGYSPLHAHRGHYINAAGNQHPGNYGWIHASFKLADQATYDQARQDLIEAGWYMVQSCRSGYGAYSYMAPGNDVMDLLGTEAASLYLKPRVNLRDDG